MTSGCIVEVHDLAKVYPAAGVTALDGVTFDIKEGEIFGYLGRNGAGKSTTVRILITLLRSSGGTARVGGFDVDSHPAEVRRIIGVVLQEAGLDDLMTGREHLVLGARLLGSSKAAAATRADELLEVFGLTTAADRLAARYSGGMRRRLAVAMALVRRPPVLFLDEPTTGLDPQSRRAFWALIRQLRGEGTTVFLTTQYLAEAEELADRVAIVHDGRIATLGTPRQLKAEHGLTTVSVEVGSLEDRARLRSALPRCGVTQAQDGSLVFAVTGGEAGVPSLLAQLVSSGVAIERLAVSPPTLEDVFVNLTGTDIGSSSDTSGGSSLAAARRGQGVVSASGSQR